MLSKNQTEQTTRNRRRGLPLYLASALIMLLAVLLTACGGGLGNGNSNTPTPLATATINPTLQQQGDAELQTFQQWIALMQQYNADSSSYQQQYTADQQALKNANSEAAYKNALAKLQG